MLMKLGHNVTTSNSPTEAIELFRENSEAFDLVITDLTMPEMTGIDFAAELHRINSRIPFILMTGYEKDSGYIKTLGKYGISKFLKKPVKLAQLASTINEVMSGARH